MKEYSLREFIAIKVPNRVLRHLPFNRIGAIQSYVERQFGALAREYAESVKPAEVTPHTNNTIWVFWAQGRDRMPEIVKRCVRQIERMKGEYQMVILTQENFSNYVDIPDHILRKLRGGKITLTHFSDILRFALLKKYGGWWMDATIYPLHQIEQRTSLYSIKTVFEPQYISECKWSSFLWYLPAGHPMACFLSDAWKVYWEENDKLIEYLLTDHLIKLFYDTNKLFHREIDALPMENENLYFMQSEEALQPFNDMRWREICQNTKFFKCAWKTKVKFDSIDLQSYIMKL